MITSDAPPQRGTKTGNPIGFGLLLLLVGGLMAVINFPAISLHATRTSTGAVNIAIERHFLFGVITTRAHAEGVRRAEVVWTESHSRRHGSTRLSDVVLYTTNGNVSVIGNRSNTMTQEKVTIADAINAFLATPTQNTWNATYRMQDIFGWIGLILLIVGILILFGALKRRIAGGA